jgi:hypothetical protein
MSPTSESIAVLEAKNDLYGGIIIDVDKLPSTADEFELRLHSSLHVCGIQAEGCQCPIWHMLYLLAK